MNSKEIRGILGISRAEFSRRYNIPIRTLENWDNGQSPPDYVLELLEQCVRNDTDFQRWIGNKYVIDGVNQTIVGYMDGLFIFSDGEDEIKKSLNEIALMFLDGRLKSN